MTASEGTKTDTEGAVNAVVRSFCTAFPPRSWSKQDTDQTIAGIKEHNATYIALCRR